MLVKLLSKVAVTDSCWEWLGYVSHNGYGRIRVGKNILYSHRVSYEVFVGAIPKGKTIDHLCRNRGCVNPEHLEAVGLRENILRGCNPAAINARKTHCIRGHPLDGENVRGIVGDRHCKTCEKLRYLGTA